MPNMLLPIEERTLTPRQVELLDKRRNRGFMFMVVSGQFAIIATLLLLWLVQDLTYSPGWAHPIAYYFFLSVMITVGAGGTGAYLRRGAPEF